jgi:aspartyl-tRNA synthetase
VNYTIKKIITADNLNKEIKVNGWINTLRLLGKIGFVELRDIFGKIQLVIINKQLISKIF